MAAACPGRPRVPQPGCPASGEQRHGRRDRVIKTADEFIRVALEPRLDRREHRHARDERAHDQRRQDHQRGTVPRAANGQAEQARDREHQEGRTVGGHRQTRRASGALGS